MDMAGVGSFFLFLLCVNHAFRGSTAAGVNNECFNGRRGGVNGSLDVACLMKRVEDISDEGKSIFKTGESQYAVNLTFTLLSVDGLSSDGTFQARFRLRAVWEDPILGWNPSELRKGQDLIVMPSSKARWPQFIAQNDQDLQRSLVDKMGNFPVVITSDGVNTMLSEVTTLTSCSVNFLYFPNDIQTCQIQLAFLPIGVRAIASFNVEYWHDKKLFGDSDDWPLYPTDSLPTVGQEIDENGTVEYIYMNVTIHRNGHSIQISLTEPMFAFSFITAIIYILPPESGERIGCAITMVLTMAVTMLTVGDVLPNSNGGDPLFSKFTQLAFAQTMLLFVESIVALALWFSSGKLFWFLRLGKQKGSKENGLKVEPVADEDAKRAKETDETEEAVEFNKVLALRIDFAFFIINLVVSIVGVTYTKVNINTPAS